MYEEVNRDNNGEADRINLEVDSKDEVMHYLNERSVIFKEEIVGRRERVTTDEKRGVVFVVVVYDQNWADDFSEMAQFRYCARVIKQFLVRGGLNSLSAY